MELPGPVPSVVRRRVLAGGLSVLAVAVVAFWGFWGLVVEYLPPLHLESKPAGNPPGRIEVDRHLAALGLGIWATVHLIVLVVFLFRRRRWTLLAIVGLQVADLAVIVYLGIREVVQPSETGPAVFAGYGLGSLGR